MFEKFGGVWTWNFVRAKIQRGSTKSRLSIFFFSPSLNSPLICHLFIVFHVLIEGENWRWNWLKIAKHLIVTCNFLFEETERTLKWLSFTKISCWAAFATVMLNFLDTIGYLSLFPWIKKGERGCKSDALSSNDRLPPNSKAPLQISGAGN